MPSNYIKRINNVEIEAAVANYVVAGSVDGPLGSNSVESSSQAVTASYINPTFISASAAASGFGGGGGGGGGTPGGSNTQIQYNSSSAFGGVPTLTYDGTTLRATGSFTGSLTGNLIGTASWATNALTASFINTLNQNLTISGNLTVSGNLNLLGTASITNISQSTLNVGTNLITVNTQTPSTRFGGLSVIDSGSSPQRSGSILFDSLNDQWIFIHQTAGTTSSVFIQSPQTYNDVGNEINLTTNRLPKSVNAEHIGDSNISDNGTIVSINSNTQITGSLFVTTGITGSFTGSLVGSSSYALTASHALNGGGGGGGGTDLGLVYAVSIGYLMP